MPKNFGIGRKVAFRCTFIFGTSWCPRGSGGQVGDRLNAAATRDGLQDRDRKSCD